MDERKESVLSKKIKNAIDTPIDIDIEEHWKGFEERLDEKKRKNSTEAIDSE